MNFVLLCLVMVGVIGAVNGDKTQSVLREVVKGQLDIIKHCVGLRGYPYRGIPHPFYHRKRYSVAFHARISNRIKNVAAGHKVIFDTVDLNEGRGYNEKDGTFTAPYNGLYAFHWTMLAGAHKSFLTELVVNNIVKGRNHAHAPGYSNNLSASEMVIVYMKKDQKAWLRVFDKYGQYLYGGGYWSSFKGYLMDS